MTDLNEDSKEREKIEMFNNLVNDKKYEVPKEDEIPNWVLAGKSFNKPFFHCSRRGFPEIISYKNPGHN